VLLAAAPPGERAQRIEERLLAEASGLHNPEPDTATGRALAADLYTRHCAECHGVTGRGDGPRASALQTRPADLVLHVPQHTDGELFHFITRGIRGSPMPSWHSVLSERERWLLVHYLRTLAR
jgi:copper transport protein